MTLILYMYIYIFFLQILFIIGYYEKEVATHSSIAWKIPLRDEPGGLQPTESQRVRHD